MSRTHPLPMVTPNQFLAFVLVVCGISPFSCAKHAVAYSKTAHRKHVGTPATRAKSSRFATTPISPGENPALSALSPFLASSLASPLVYNATVLNEWGFKRATCGKADFLVADTGMVDRWICSAEGERVVTAAMDSLLSAGCRGRGSGGTDSVAAPLFLDVGSNSGFYGLNAISHGCETVFFDVQPGCNKVVNAALLVNDFGSRGVVMAAGLSDRADVVRAKSSSTCSFDSGRFPMSAIESGTLDEGDVGVPVVPLSRLVLSTSSWAWALTSSTASSAAKKKPRASKPQIFMMKIDTEGLEQRVLAGAMPLFKDQAIEHVIVEVTPGFQFWEKNGVRAADVAATMRAIAAFGYSFTRLHSKAGDDKDRILTDPERVHALFLERPFDQEDFLISRT